MVVWRGSGRGTPCHTFLACGRVLTVAGTGIGLALFVVASLLMVFDMRIELAGSGWQPIVSFGDVNDHFSSLEQNRSQHYSRLLPARPAAAESDASLAGSNA